MAANAEITDADEASVITRPFRTESIDLPLLSGTSPATASISAPSTRGDHWSDDRRAGNGVARSDEGTLTSRPCRHHDACPDSTTPTRSIPRSRQEWRAWLAARHETSPGVWLVGFTQASGKAKLPYEDIVEELLCFGCDRLHDPQARRPAHDAVRRPRKKGGTWAATNKARVERLVAAGLMHEAGLRVIEAAKADGSWTILDPVEALEVPSDLQDAFDRHPPAQRGYDALGNGGKKQVLWSVVSAKRPETRAARIARIIEQLG